jgi:hypothetical protein
MVDQENQNGLSLYQDYCSVRNKWSKHGRQTHIPNASQPCDQRLGITKRQSEQETATIISTTPINLPISLPIKNNSQRLLSN